MCTPLNGSDLCSWCQKYKTTHAKGLCHTCYNQKSRLKHKKFAYAKKAHAKKKEEYAWILLGKAYFILDYLAKDR